MSGHLYQFSFAENTGWYGEQRTLAGDGRSNGNSSHGEDGSDNGKLHFENSVQVIMKWIREVFERTKETNCVCMCVCCSKWSPGDKESEYEKQGKYNEIGLMRLNGRNRPSSLTGKLAPYNC